MLAFVFVKYIQYKTNTYVATKTQPGTKKKFVIRRLLFRKNNEQCSPAADEKSSPGGGINNIILYMVPDYNIMPDVICNVFIQKYYFIRW
jgi:hypothetical protein